MKIIKTIPVFLVCIFMLQICKGQIDTLRIWENVGRYYLENEDKRESIKSYLSEMAEIHKKRSDHQGYLNSIEKLGRCYLMEGDIENTVKEFKKIVHYTKPSENKEYEKETTNKDINLKRPFVVRFIVKYYLEKKDFESALDYMKLFIGKHRPYFGCDVGEYETSLYESYVRIKEEERGMNNIDTLFRYGVSIAFNEYRSKGYQILVEDVKQILFRVIEENGLKEEIISMTEEIKYEDKTSRLPPKFYIEIKGGRENLHDKAILKKYFKLEKEGKERGKIIEEMQNDYKLYVEEEEFVKELKKM